MLFVRWISRFSFFREMSGSWLEFQLRATDMIVCSCIHTATATVTVIRAAADDRRPGLRRRREEAKNKNGRGEGSSESEPF
jgi:hypothetical protein